MQALFMNMSRCSVSSSAAGQFYIHVKWHWIWRMVCYQWRRFSVVHLCCFFFCFSPDQLSCVIILLLLAFFNALLWKNIKSFLKIKASSVFLFLTLKDYSTDSALLSSGFGFELSSELHYPTCNMIIDSSGRDLGVFYLCWLMSLTKSRLQSGKPSAF